MSKTVDERVVQMRFDNSQFERNVSTSMSTLDKLKQSLKLDGMSKGLENVNSAAKSFDVSPLSNGIETVRAKFSALEVMAVTALANITNSAVNAGKRLISAFTIEPIKTGFNEFELKMGSVQTIMASTGASLEDVNGYLEELNEYSDKTIYSFSDMTNNIGKFTNAGVKLEDAVVAIKGISNEAALSGANANEASRAMYNFSQALSAGYVKLIDWKSIENANMATVGFKTELINSAVACGTLKDNLDGTYTTVKGTVINATQNFNDSLQDQWMTTDVLVSTLKNYADETTDIGKKAFAAAQDVKTFSMMMDTLKEAAQSGWAMTWETVIGDFEEGKALWTSMAEYFGGIIDASSDARNKVLKDWKDLGGRDAAIEGIKNAFNGLLSVLQPIKEAFREVFPPATGKNLADITKKFADFTAKLKLSEPRAEKLKETFKGMFSLLSIMGKVLGAVAGGIGRLFGSDGAGNVLDLLLDLTSAIGRFFTSLNEGFKADGLRGLINELADSISNFLAKIDISFPAVGNGIVKVVTTIWNAIKQVFSFIRENVSAGDIFAGLAGGGIFAAAKNFSGLIDKIKDAIDGLFGDGGAKSKFSDVLDSLHNSLESFSTGIKVASIVSIAIAVGILSASLKTISQIDALDVAKSLTAIASMMVMLNLSLKSMTKTLSKFDSKGLIKSGVALVLLSTSILILANALEKVATIPFTQLIKGLAAIGVMLLELTLALKLIDGAKVKLSTSIALLALAESCKILADALAKFGALYWDEIKRGLIAMGGALTELVVAISVLQKFGGFKSLISSIGIFVIVQSLSKLADALKKFGKMKWDEIGRGLAAMGGALAELVAALAILGKFGGFSSLFAAGAIFIVIQGLDDLATALAKFGAMGWGEIGRGLTAMGGALGEVSVALGALGLIAGFSSLFAAGAILIVIQGLDDLSEALSKFGLMTWEEIGRGLTAMGGALAELAVILGALGLIGGFSSLFAAGAILIVIQGLDDLAAALARFGAMTWEEIGRGLVAMGAALAEVALICGGLGWVAGVAGLVGAGTILLAVQGLDDLANALMKFGSMNWEEINRGLTAMGAAMGEVALGALLNTFSGFGAAAIAEIAAPLGDLADSVQKWANVTVPEGLGEQLGSLADGVMAFTFGGWGAGAIAEVAEPLGTLAGSVQKWYGVVIPEGIGEQLSSLASGVQAFTWAFMGGFSIGTIAEPLGTLSDSVRKWSGVTLPENLESNLTSLANGVKAFSWAFMAGWSLSALNEPLGALADSVKKWNGVSLPENLESNLSSLADGVKSFTWAFMAGWSIDAIAEPLTTLASSVKAWNGVTISQVLTERLAPFGQAVSSFALDVSTVTTINSSNITSFANAIVTLNNSVSSIVAVDAGRITSFVNAVKQLNGLKIDASALTSSAQTIVTSITQMMTSITTTINTGKIAINTSMRNAMTGAVQAIRTAIPQIRNAGTQLVNGLVKAITSRKSAVTSACKNLVSGAASAIRTHYSSFSSAGGYLGDGLVAGINSKKTAAYNAGYALGQAAVQGEKDGQQSKSPSKATIKAGKWLGEGLVIGIDRMGSDVYKSGKSLGENAVNSISGALEKVTDLTSNDMNIKPTIRPVVDMTNMNDTEFKLGASVDTFLTRPIDSLSSVIANAQNEINASNNEVIGAIIGLREDLNSLYEMVNEKETSLYVDSKKLATSIAKPMNRELNILAKRGAY